MGNISNLKDDFLKGMFKKSSLESPSDGFTDSVMNRIQIEVVQNVEDNKPIIEPKYWLIILSGIAVAAYMLFQMDWSFMGSLFGSISMEPIELPKLSFALLDNAKQMLQGFTIPPLFLVAVAAIISLFTIDRILKQRLNVYILFF